ncbi:MAG: Mth938-like domain-containing protein [Pseudoxanthomonas sp.]
MYLNREIPDYAYVLLGADGRSARVNDRVLTSSFILSPMQLTEQWTSGPATSLTAEHLAPLLALDPELVLLGTGERQVFPPAAAMAVCLTRGIGIEVMANPAAARTFNVLASEGRRVVAGFLFNPA